MRIFFNNTSLQPPRYPPFRYAFIVGFIVVGILLFTFNEDTFAQNDANAVYVRVIESETYFIHSYTSVGTRNFTPPAGVTQIEYLVVGGGGGGGGGNGDRGGGGAGGFVAGELTLTETALAVTVGDGGVGGFGITIENAMGKPGENSSIGNTIIARGGGGGGAFINDGVEVVPGGDGGSGGGGGGGALLKPGGESIQSDELNPGAIRNIGYKGGAGVGGGFGSGRNAGGGGGGAAGPGGDSSSNSNDAGNGGAGQSSSIMGFTGFYAGGGGGAGFNNGGTGGIGGGGNGGSGSSGNGQHGEVNSGGGGGAGSTSGDGGSGIVIIRYKASEITNFTSTSITADQFFFDDDLTFPANKILTLNGPALVTANLAIGDNATLSFNENLTIEGSLNIGSGGSIHLLSGTIATVDTEGSVSSSGTLRVHSDALFCNFGTGNPSLSLSRELRSAEGWRTLSTPVSGSYSDLLDGIWTQGAAGASYPGGSPNVFIWPDNQADNNSEILRQQWIPVTDLGGAISAGKGILVYVYEGDADGGNSGWPKELTTAGVEQGAVNISPLNTTVNGWTLLGNPFACAISYVQLFNQSGTNNVTQSVYVWDPNDNSGEFDDTLNPSGSWKTYNVSTNSGDLTNGIMMPFQAFFVQNSASNSSVDFNKSVQSSIIREFLGKEAVDRNSLRLELNGEMLRSSAWIHFSEAGSIEQSPGDAFQLQPLSEHFSILASDKSGSLLDIGHYPVPDHDFILPLAIETTRPGVYTLTATDILFPDYLDLYFNDRKEDVVLPIDDSFSYRFTLNPLKEKLVFDSFDPVKRSNLKLQSDHDSRFYLSSSPSNFYSDIPRVISLLQNYPNPFNPSTTIRYELPEYGYVRLSVYDMIGRRIAILVEGQMQAGLHQVNFDAGSLSSGIYLYRLEAGNSVLTKKLSLIK